MPMTPRRRAIPSLTPGPSGLRMKQILSATYGGPDGNHSYSVIGLGTDGIVYRYSARDEAWIQYSMRRATGSNSSH